MKNLSGTFLLLTMLLQSHYNFAQITIVEGFENAFPPAGWVDWNGNLTKTTNTPCVGSASVRKNQWSGSVNGGLITPIHPSNGQDLTISFKYKVVDYVSSGNPPTTATPNSPAWGSIIIELSTNAGTNYTVNVGTIDPTNHTPSLSCTTMTYIVPAAVIPIGTDVRVRWRLTFAGTTPDYLVYLDDVSVTQPLVAPPTCVVNPAPVSGATGISVAPALSWQFHSGATSYDVYLGTTPNPPFVSNVAATTYNPGTLSGSTTYYWKVIGKNDIGAATGCSEWTFTTLTLPVNDECANAISITSAPGIFQSPGVQTSTNATQSLAAGSGGSCNPVSSSAHDVWYRFQTNTSGTARIVVTPTSSVDIVLQAYSACGTPIAGTCTDYPFPGINGAETLNLTGLSASTTYYFRVYRYTSGSTPPASFSFNITATGTALPLEIISFSGKILADANLLVWATGEEKNVDVQVIERSTNGTQWAEIGRADAQGSNSTYEFEDRAPLAKTYYRLRVLDTDGSQQLSNAILLNRRDKGFGITSTFPSPTTGPLTVEYSTPDEGPVTLYVNDFTGRTVLQQTIEAGKGNHTASLSLAHLPVGAYTLHISNTHTMADPVRVVKQ